MMKGFMKNSSKTSSVPLTGWMYFDFHIKDFHKDTSVKIKFGELTKDDISGKVRVQFKNSVLKNFNHEGEYEMTGKYVNGKPIYKNNYGICLISDDKGWSIVGPGTIIFSTSESGFCPSQSCSFNLFSKGGTRVWRIRAFAALCVITILPLAVLTIVTMVKVIWCSGI